MQAFASKKPAKTQYLTQKLIHIKPIDYAMRKQLIFILTAFFALNHSFAQTQQKLSYDIKVALNDQTNTLNAHESLAYTNNFDAQISVLYFHLWPNAYKNNQTAFAKQQLNSGKTKFYYAPDSDKGYIDSLNFMVNGEKVKWELLTDSIDICRIYLPKPLKKGETINISTPFRVKLPISFSRGGHTEQAYQATQWYPKPAVFNGKKFVYMPYLDQGEFYSEFGDFHVSITLPKNYVVGATGVLETESEQNFLDSLATETAKITDFDPKNLAFPASDAQTKTIHYYQDNVHDFAWFADKRFHVLHSQIQLPNSKRTVKTQVMFTNLEGNLWKKGAMYVDSSVYYYSLWNGDYPYTICTALESALSAGAGMEYPTVTVIGEMSNARSLEIVIAHEVGHNWFYGILGSNERDFGWMDEGINSYYETRYTTQRFGAESPLASIGLPANIKIKAKFPANTDAFISNLQCLRLKDQPCQLNSNEMTGINYGAIMYKKTAALFFYLADHLGQEKFDAIMQKYYTTWQYKHPQPQDLQAIFETESGEKLNWFFDDLIATTKHLDYALFAAKKTANNNFVIRAVNAGSINAPVKISAMTKQNEVLATQTFEGFADIKKLNFDASKITQPIHHFTIDPKGAAPEYNVEGNRLRANGILKGVQLAKPSFLLGVDDVNQRKFYYAPIIGGNRYDSWLVGAAIYNSFLPKDIQAYIMPLYSTATKSLVGQAGMDFYYYPKKHNGAKSLRYSLNLKSYHYNEHYYANFVGGPKTFYDRFTRSSLDLVYIFKPKGAASKITHQATASLIEIQRKETLVKSVNDSLVGLLADTTYQKAVLRLGYEIKNTRVLNPYSLNATFVGGANYGESQKSFGRLSVEAKYKLSYQKKKKGLDVRLFAGGFLWHKFTPIIGLPGYRTPNDADLRLSSYTGSDDFLYDNTYLARSENSGALSKQMHVADGGFKVLQNGINPPVGRNSLWLTAINLESSLPVTPLKIFVDYGFFPQSDVTTGTKTIQKAYDAGVSLHLLKGAFVLYAPIVVSENLKNNPNGNEFYRNISFSINFLNKNLFQLIRDIEI